MIELEATLTTSEDLDATIAEAENLEATADTSIVLPSLDYVGLIADTTTKLKDTAFNGWTPSTTAKAIITGGTVGTFTAADIKAHPYYIRHLIDIKIVYNDGTAAAKAMYLRTVGAVWQSIARRPSTEANLDASNLNSNIAEAITTSWVGLYHTAAATKAIAYTTSYGFYPANVNSTISSTSAASPTITVKGPTINARCSTTYLSTTLAGKIDQEKSTVRVRTEVFRAKGGYERNLYHAQLCDVWNGRV